MPAFKRRRATSVFGFLRPKTNLPTPNRLLNFSIVKVSFHIFYAFWYQFGIVRHQFYLYRTATKIFCYRTCCPTTCEWVKDYSFGWTPCKNTRFNQIGRIGSKMRPFEWLVSNCPYISSCPQSFAISSRFFNCLIIKVILFGLR